MTEKPLNGLGKRSISRALLLGSALALTAAAFLDGQEPKKADLRFPKYVLIIRHAEKPPAGTPSVDLSARGEKRARALHKLFEKSRGRPSPFPRPDFLFATHNTSSSHRPVDTLKPLAAKLDLPLDSSFRNNFRKLTKAEKQSGGEGFRELDKEILRNKRYRGKTVLVCWHHGTIPELARRLKAKRVPGKWKGSVFDRVWQISYDEKGKTTFADLPQRLLPGDSSK
jgi:broad specificity phosphatase PhoE